MRTRRCLRGPPFPHARPSPPPPTPQAIFRGDAPHLLDRLVEACQQKTVHAPLPGYGRELQPVCGDWLVGANPCDNMSASLEASR